ncbi:MAG TPA: peroxidase-related enzyme [Candidatus Thermoplasmatota archaeon]|nr:peroxidase-related enzyme [Candidatus Thermoplasmatota archaeon]
MARIRIIRSDEAEGQLKEAYARIAKERGSVAEVHQVASLHPELMLAHLDFYLTLMYGRGGLSRRERELVGTVVSRTNRCEYCVTHHAEAFARYEKDAALVEALARDPASAPLAPRDRALADFAKRLTRDPAGIRDEDADRLRALGFEDKDILAAGAIAASSTS